MSKSLATLSELVEYEPKSLFAVLTGYLPKDAAGWTLLLWLAIITVNLYSLLSSRTKTRAAVLPSHDQEPADGALPKRAAVSSGDVSPKGVWPTPVPLTLPPPTFTCPIPTVPMLDKYDFAGLELRLRRACMLFGWEAALDNPLDIADYRNVNARILIEDSVPVGPLKDTMGTSGVAYTMMQNLASKYRNLDFNEFSKLQEAIKSMVLSDFDSESVEKHLRKVIEGLGKLQTARANLSDQHKRFLLADTLIGDE